MTGVENNLSRFLQELCFLNFKHLKQILNLQCFLNQLLLTQHILDITISVSKYLRVNSTFAVVHFFDTYIHTYLSEQFYGRWLPCRTPRSHSWASSPSRGSAEHSDVIYRVTPMVNFEALVK